MKRPKKKLVLDTNVVRDLTTKNLREVAGGSVDISGSGRPNCIPPGRDP
jgi:hypothetical protein